MRDPIYWVLHTTISSRGLATSHNSARKAGHRCPGLSDPTHLSLRVSARFILLSLGPPTATFALRFSRETEPARCACVYAYVYVYTHTHTEIHYKELAHVILEAGKSRICRVGWQSGDPGEQVFQLKSEGCLRQNQEETGRGKSQGSLLENSVLLGEDWPFYSMQTFT